VSNRRVRLESATALLEPGGVVDGTVKSLRTYGAVVTLESGVEALLHVSQISQVFVQNVSDVLGEGDAVRCVVIKVDADDGSISLSTKMLESKPGEMLRNASAVFERSSSAAQVDGAAAAA
jgi:small subunit ribosomal protein S1